MEHYLFDLLNLLKLILVLDLYPILLNLQINSLVFDFQRFQLNLRGHLRKVYLIRGLFWNAVCPLGQVVDEPVCDARVSTQVKTS